MNSLLTITLLIALTSGVAAQQKPAARPRDKAQKTEAPATPSKPAAAQPDAAAPAKESSDPKPADPAAVVMEKLKAWDARLETLKAQFTQEVNFTEAGLKQSIEGTLSYAKPNLLRIEHLKPSRQLVVTDKKDIWIYKPEDKQAVRTQWDSWRRTQDQNFSGILDFGNYAALAARNEVRVSGGIDGAPTVVTFIPRSGKGYSLALTLSAEDYFPTGAELTVDGTIISTRLSAVEKNGKMDKTIFSFKPPKGTEILEFRN
jgi:outer membrane lipoprotein carrier protein